jgi:hypothetical protein
VPWKKPLFLEARRNGAGNCTACDDRLTTFGRRMKAMANDNSKTRLGSPSAHTKPISACSVMTKV